MKVPNHGATDEMQSLILLLLTSFLPKIISHGVTPVPTGHRVSLPRGAIGHNKPFATTVGWIPPCPWTDTAVWPQLSHAGTSFPGNNHIQAKVPYIPAVFGS